MRRPPPLQLFGCDEEYLAAVERYDAIHYVRIPGRRRLLFQYGRRDEVFG
jgi:hypothetical protein